MGGGEEGARGEEISQIDMMKCLGGHMECLGGMRLQSFLALFTRATPGTPASSPDIEVVIDFLSQLFEKVLGYSCINSARSALSTFININNNPVGQHPLVVRLMKGILTSDPA